MAGTDIEGLAREVGGEIVASKQYSRIRVGGRTLAYVRRGSLDFKASDVAKAPSGARAKLTTRGNRATGGCPSARRGQPGRC